MKKNKIKIKKSNKIRIRPQFYNKDDKCYLNPEFKENSQTTHHWHCKKCMEELDSLKKKGAKISPREFENLEIGYTKMGLEVWCKRHDMQVAYINLYDIWSTLNTLKRNEGRPEMPLLSTGYTDTSNLAYTGISGVYIDPEIYFQGKEDELKQLQKYSRDLMIKEDKSPNVVWSKRTYKRTA